MRTLDNNTMVRFHAVKHLISLERAARERFFLRDTSGPNAQGYSYDLVRQKKTLINYHDEQGHHVLSDWEWVDEKTIASSHDTFMPEVRNKIGSLGAYGPTFDRADIEQIHDILRGIIN